MPPVFPPVKAGSIGELARGARSSIRRRSRTTVATLQRCGPSGHVRPHDARRLPTEGLEPPKTHWARPIDTPPYFGYPLRPGITFTYLGVAVNERAQMLMADGKPSANVFAAGEIMAGNILGKGYLAGFGMTIGTMFGRIAGEEAARHARA